MKSQNSQRIGSGVSVTLVAGFLLTASVNRAVGQVEEKQGSTTLSETQTIDAPSTKAGLSRSEALERAFQETMAGARLEGFWQMTGEGGLTGRRALTEPKTESYVISKVSKIGGDKWLVFARITFADKDVNVPVPVRVVWAGDTAVITLDDIGVPLIGTYSARVMVHNGFYSGIWYSNEKNYGGVMAGRIVSGAGEKKADAPREESHGDSPDRIED